MYIAHTLDISRRANSKSRRYRFEGLREKDRLAFDEISFLSSLGHHFPPKERPSSAQGGDVGTAHSGIPHD